MTFLKKLQNIKTKLTPPMNHSGEDVKSETFNEDDFKAADGDSFSREQINVLSQLKSMIMVEKLTPDNIQNICSKIDTDIAAAAAEKERIAAAAAAAKNHYIQFVNKFLPKNNQLDLKLLNDSSKDENSLEDMLARHNKLVPSTAKNAFKIVAAGLLVALGLLAAAAAVAAIIILAAPASAAALAMAGTVLAVSTAVGSTAAVVVPTAIGVGSAVAAATMTSHVKGPLSFTRIKENLADRKAFHIASTNLRAAFSPSI